MSTLLIVLCPLGICFFVTLIFTLMSAGRRADVTEDKLSQIILAPPSEDIAEHSKSEMESISVPA